MNLSLDFVIQHAAHQNINSKRQKYGTQNNKNSNEIQYLKTITTIVIVITVMTIIINNDNNILQLIQ